MPGLAGVPALQGRAWVLADLADMAYPDLPGSVLLGPCRSPANEASLQLQMQPRDQIHHSRQVARSRSMGTPLLAQLLGKLLGQLMWQWLGRRPEQSLGGTGQSQPWCIPGRVLCRMRQL